MVDWHSLVWRKDEIPRCSLIPWIACKDRMRTLDRLRRGGLFKVVLVFYVRKQGTACFLRVHTLGKFGEVFYIEMGKDMNAVVRI